MTHKQCEINNEKFEIEKHNADEYGLNKIDTSSVKSILSQKIASMLFGK